jgi:hypothetical protein
MVHLPLRVRALKPLLMHIRTAFIATSLKRACRIERIPVRPDVGMFLADPISSFGSALLYGEYEPEMMRTMRQFLGPGSVFVDVGANEGDFAVLGGRLVGPTGRVIANRNRAATSRAAGTRAKPPTEPHHERHRISGGRQRFRRHVGSVLVVHEGQPPTLKLALREGTLVWLQLLWIQIAFLAGSWLLSLWITPEAARSLNSLGIPIRILVVGPAAFRWAM